MIAVPSLSARIGRDLLDRLVQAWIDNSRDETILKEVEQALADHLAQLRDLGIVRPYDALPNRRMNLVHSWNVMCGTAEHRYSSQEGETLQVARRFVSPMITTHVAHLAFDLRKAPGSEARERGLVDIMEKIDSGQAPAWLIGGEEHDFVSGEEFAFTISDWNLVIGRRVQGSDDLEPINDLPPTTLHEVEFDLPTGEILLADWFRADGFTDLVDEGNPWRGGSQQENEQDAERYVRDYGFASVSSIWRSLSILTDGKSLTVGHHDEDGDHPLPAGYRRLRDLTIDLRKVSLADRASLKGTLSRIHAPDEAERLVDELVKDRNTIRVRLPAGRYRVISSGRGYIEDLLENGHPLKVEGYEPVMILEKV